MYWNEIVTRYVLVISALLGIIFWLGPYSFLADIRPRGWKGIVTIWAVVLLAGWWRFNFSA